MRDEYCASFITITLPEYLPQEEFSLADLYLLELIQNELQGMRIDKERFLFINFESNAVEYARSAKETYQYIKNIAKQCLLQLVSRQDLIGKSILQFQEVDFLSSHKNQI